MLRFRIIKKFLLVLVTIFLIINMLNLLILCNDFSYDERERSPKGEGLPPSHSTQTNSRSSSRAFLDAWGMSGIDLTNLDDPNKNTIYAGYKPYTFRFIVDDFDAFENVSVVKIELVDEEKNYSWDRLGRGNTNGQCSRAVYTTSFYKIAPDVAFLDFNITFGWTNTNTSDQHLCNISITEKSSSEYFAEVWLEYSVVRRIKFTGKFEVTGEVQGILNEFDWVRKLEMLTWSGLKVIYDSAQNFHPPKSQCQITLYNDEGKSWKHTTDPEEEMIIITQTEAGNDENDEYLINISGPAQKNLFAHIEFVIRVDGDGITFYNPIPKHDDWSNSKNVLCGISISDNDTSGVDPDTIEFQYSDDGGGTWSTWYIPDVKIAGNYINCTTNITFKEGSENLIRWRGKDKVGNEFSLSEIYRISIDLTRPTFNNPVPKASELLYDTLVNCSTEVNDEFSGVLGSSISYSVQLQNENFWSKWQSVEISKNNNTITAKAQVQFEYGSENYIKWRAQDGARNNYSYSEPYQVRITHEIPKVRLISPLKGSLINSTKPKFQWVDSYEFIQEVTYAFQYWQENDQDNIIQINLTETFYIPDKPLKYNTKYFWRVIPKAIDPEQIGTSESGIWNLTVDSEANIYPEYKFEIRTFTKDLIQIKPTEKKNIELILFNRGNQDDTYSMKIITDAIWEPYIFYESRYNVPVNSSVNISISVQVPEGVNYSAYPIKIVITSFGAKLLNQIVDQTILLEIEVIKEEKEDKIILGFFELGIMVLIIIVIIVLGALIIFKSSMKEKKFKTRFGRSGKEADIVYKPELSKAVDRRSKSTKTQKTKQK